MEHHPETSPTGTFRVVEEEVEAEEELDTQEVPSNPRIGVEVGATMRSTASGMPHNHLALVEGHQLRLRLRRHGGRLTVVEIATMSLKKDLRTETPRKRTLLPTTPKIMMTERGLEVPAPEMTDIGGTEAMKDITPEEITMMRVETTVEIMVPAQVGGSIVRSEETIIMTGKKEGTRAPGIDQIQDLDTRGKTLQMKAGDTRDTIGEGDAKGPWVMKGPSQVNP